MGKKLDIKNPKTFNEKLQWLKIFDRNPDYIKMVDKYKVREYISEKLGVSRRWIATNMKRLQDTGVVKRIGPNNRSFKLHLSSQ